MTTEIKTRTITLSNRPPVRIRDDEWQLIASADWHDGDQGLRCRAHRTAWLKVRQHDDGRTIVYAGYDSDFSSERDLRAGLLLAPADDVVSAIREVAARIERLAELADRAIADLPAEEI
jgi:hypothetical protein